jgi:hypothetical protein
MDICYRDGAGTVSTAFIALAMTRESSFVIASHEGAKQSRNTATVFVTYLYKKEKVVITTTNLHC